MSLNLHSIVRGPIQAVNTDTVGVWLRSTGSTGNPDGSKTPTYATPQSVTAQVQPPSGEALKHAEFLNIQGTLRSVYLYPPAQSISRVDSKGGDLVQFPQYPGAPVENWLVYFVEEQGWNLDQGGWSKVAVVLQTDRPS